MEAAVRERFERIESLLAELGRRNAEALARMDKAEARMNRSEARMDRSEARMDRAEARMDKSDARFEKRMRGFEKLAVIGMKELAQLRRNQKEHDEKLNALIDSQQRTEASLRRWLESLRRGSNGR
jgi:division protein CdvB (Snf7/Vps24/ESCRT-III family)